MRKATELIDVAGVPFKVIKRNPANMSPLDGEFGCCSPIEGAIRVNGKMPREVYEQTLIHEWVHGLLTGVDHSEAVAIVLSTELYRQGFRAPRWKCPPKSSKRRVAVKHISRKRK